MNRWRQHFVNESLKGLSSLQFEIAQEKLKYQLGGLFGYFALLYTPKAKQLVGENIVVKKSVTISEQASLSDLVCRFEELPIASDSIDLAVLPDVLQKSNYPHQILREVERVLIPDGHIILIFENPLSWQGLKKRVMLKIAKPKQKANLFGKLRISDWFRLLGLEVVNEVPVCVSDERIQKSGNPVWLKNMVHFMSGYFSSYYIIVAKKKVSTMTPIRPSWRSNRKLVSPRFADSSVNSQVDDLMNQIKR